MSEPSEHHYDPRSVERKWQATWHRAGVFRAQRDDARPKYFIMEMFPYPSGRLHMGHVRNYTIGDVLARVARMHGRAVLYPVGWDAFGLPAENAAIKAKVHPRTWTLQNIGHMREQFVLLGLSYDWDREVTTCEPEYFVHEQRIFIEMWRRGLAYRKAAVVNWCPGCQTVLANEQVEEGLCWRCRSAVHARELEQWFLKVTAYAEELLAGLKALAGKWPDAVLRMQEHWIGRSEGARIRFALDGASADEAVEVFTTRADTLFGATFVTVAAEHPLVARADATARQFAAEVAKEDKIQRTSTDSEKRGISTGLFCRHPVTGARLPIYIANFVLLDYGTGAVMGVPAHDERDWAFAATYGLDRRVVIQPEGEAPLDVKTMQAAYTGPGRLVASGEFDGMESEAARAAITDKVGVPTVTYRIRDWLLSRQRYWGCPIPMVRCETHGYQPVPAAELPVRLPDDVLVAEGGRAPLASHPSWSAATCPECHGPAQRETDTMDGFMDSSWYFLRYTSPHSSKWLDEREVAYWMAVDQYIGGAEHATKHLIYARFFTKMLRDWGWLPPTLDEPFLHLINQGMVVKETYQCPKHDYLYPEEVKEGRCSHCGQPVVVGRTEKMSKSLKNVVEPLPLIEKYGADTVRIFSLFAAPPESMLEWSDAAMEGAWRFLNRVYRLVEKQLQVGFAAEAGDELRHKTHLTIKRVTDDIERIHFNTAIAAVMELVNAIYQAEAVDREAVETVVRLLAPMAPHLCEELWQRLGHTEEELLVTHPWPTFDPELAAKRRIAYPVQINGKLRGQVDAEPETGREAIEAAARATASVIPWLDGKEVTKVIFVPGRLINFVVRG